MHLLTLDRDGPTLAKGRWVMEDNNAAEYMLMNQAVRPSMEPWRATYFDTGGSRVLLIAVVAYGDAICLTPVLREMKRRYGGWSLEVACMEAQRQVFLGLPYVDGFVDYPVNVERLKEFDSVQTLEHAVEFNDDAKAEHITDRFAHHLGFTGKWTANKKPDLILSGAEISWAKSTFPRNKGRRRLAIQVQAGARCRTYPISQFSPEMDNMVRAGWEIALLGSPGEFRSDRLSPGIIDMTRHGLTWRQSAAFMTTCDCFLGPDSSLLHVAGTLDIPAVGLFGPFPWKLRTSYYSSTFSLHGNGACPMAPCFHTTHTGLPIFPANGPCQETGICNEVAAITPERIRAKLEQLVPSLPEAPQPALPAE